MATERTNFSKKDIGAEILPILTSGLYRDSLDALREYIQNGIDADATHIRIAIDPDTVSIVDNGNGMTLEVAKRAIRLGISDKNPEINIGFRGIGIYSAFNLCDHVEIHTRSASAENNNGYIIHFDFAGIRRKLMAEQLRRREGQTPELYLESLLEDAVYVVETGQSIIDGTGTHVILSGLSSDVYSRMNDRGVVVDYLQNVVPLPFDPKFKFGPQIAERFAQEDYRIVELTLLMNGENESLYRPYTDELFKEGGRHSPEFFPITNKSVEFGFAWVCVNDARETIKDENVRGLLIKKLGFSVSDRKYLEPYFGRTIYSRRITGEVVIKNSSLIPNAARSDFENNSTRQLFLETLPKFTRSVDAWANEIQEDERAREVLQNIDVEIVEIHQQLVKVQRDKEKLLQINVQLAEIEKRLRTQSKRLGKIDEQGLSKTKELLDGSQSFVKKALLSQRKTSSGVEQEVVRAMQRAELARSVQATSASMPQLNSLTAVLEAFSLLESRDLRKAVQYIDENVIQPSLTPSRYTEVMSEIRTFLEENI